MVKSRSSAILSVALVFLSGALVGAVANRLYMVNTVSSTGTVQPVRPPERNPEEVRKHLVEQMRSDVKLDDQQVLALEKIYDHTREQFDEMHKRWDGESRSARDKQTEEIRAMLRPEQMPLYDQHRAKQDAERKARHKGENKGEKGRP
jgi:hypothetical protein